MRIQTLLLSVAIIGLSAAMAAADDPQPGYILTQQDLQQLSPKARREVLAIIARQQPVPVEQGPSRPVDVNIGPIFQGNVDRGNVDLRILGGLIRINRGNGRAVPGQFIEPQPNVNLGDAPQFGATSQLGQPAAPASKYRIGIVGNTLLPEPNAPANAGLGVYLDEVEADSPAAAAGLKQGDIITAVDDQPVKTLDQLIAAVEARNGKAMSVTYARDQDVLETKLTPAPNNTAPAPAPEPALDIPDDLAISVTKIGNEPATITVSRGEKQWSVRSDQIAELPDAVRPYVEQLLNQPASSNAPPEPGPELPTPELNAPATSKAAKSTVPSPTVPGVDLGTPSTLP